MLHSNRLHWPSASSSSGSGSIDFGMCRICRTMTGDWPFKKRFHSFDLKKKEIEFPCFSSNSSSSSTKNTRVRGECTFQLKKCFLFSLPIRRWPFPDWNRTIVELEFTSLKWNEFFSSLDSLGLQSQMVISKCNWIERGFKTMELVRAHARTRRPKEINSDDERTKVHCWLRECDAPWIRSRRLAEGRKTKGKTQLIRACVL